MKTAEQNKVSFTPGPWQVAEHVMAGDVCHLAVVNRNAGNDWMPCSVTPMHTARPVDYANARLIAAAPSMFDALKTLVAAATSLHAPSIMAATDKAVAVLKEIEQ